MTCPKCGNPAEKIHWNQGLPGEGASGARAGYGLNHGHPITGGIGIGWLTAKILLSTPYYCRTCRKHGRKWF